MCAKLRTTINVAETAMPVYIINNMTIQDRAEYETYLGAFMGVFRQFDGQVLAVQNAPAAFEGEWPFDRTVILSFPDREQLLRWYESPEYQAIVGHRFKGTTSNVVILDGLPPSA
jgi:uncharacterized protein (DUF1330 family)